nr:MAG TPA: hypothetical protein [Caudoviricetes sp.]
MNFLTCFSHNLSIQVNHLPNALTEFFHPAAHQPLSDIPIRSCLRSIPQWSVDLLCAVSILCN